MTCYISVGNNNKKIGIVANSYDEFSSKATKKLYGRCLKNVIVTLEDGTEIDREFFPFIDPNTILHVSEEKVNPLSALMDEYKVFIENLISRECSLQEQISLLHENKDLRSFGKLISKLQYISCEEAYIRCNSITEHPLWFKGLNTKFTTKEDVMKNSAEVRMRGYFSNVRKGLESCTAKSNVATILQYFHKKLKYNRYNSNYFDRTSDKFRLCDSSGNFNCFGPYNETLCVSNHRINPYASQETRIIFSTWNFDHKIEKNRTIVPFLKELLQNKDISCINFDYFYDLLFVHHSSCPDDCGNLKLVHIACHIKLPHCLSIDICKVYVQLVNAKVKINEHQKFKKLKVS